MAVLAEQFDIVVLGGGPAGYATALYGAAAGLNIALVEEGRVGGACLHRGCIPAKELLQTAEVLRTIQRAPDFGVDAGVPILDLNRSQARKQEVIDRLTKGLESLLKGRKVTVYNSRGEVADAAEHRVRLADGTEIEGDEPGDRHRLDAPLTARPRLRRHAGALVRSRARAHRGPARGSRSSAVVSSAPSSRRMLADMGSEVTMIEALPRILASTDVDAGSVVARSFKKRGVNVHTSVARHRHRGRDASSTVTWETDAGENSVAGRQDHREHRARAAAAPGSVSRPPAWRSTIAASSSSTTRCAPRSPACSRPATSSTRRQLAHVGFAEAIVIVKTILGEPVDARRLRQGAVGRVLPARGRVVRPHRGAGARAWVTTWSSPRTGSPATPGP